MPVQHQNFGGKVANPRWTGFTHTAKAQMQSQDDLPIPSETPLNLKMFNARLTRSLMPASSCGFRLKDFELSIQDESEVQLYNLSVGLLQCSRSGVHRKVGNVALISPTGVPGLDQMQVFASGCFGIIRIWSCAIWWPLKSSATKSSSPKTGEAGFQSLKPTSSFSSST